VLFLSSLAIIATLSPLPFIQFRYVVDFATLIILSACIVWFYYDQKLASNKISRIILRSIGTILAIISILVGMAFGITGENNALYAYNPKEYQKVESLFTPSLNTRDLSFYTKPIHFKMKVHFTNRTVGVLEPLITTGKHEEGDFLFARYLPNNEIIFAIDHWGRSSFVQSKPIFVNNNIHLLEIYLGSDKDSNVYMEIDGKEIFHEPLRHFQTTQEEITVGENRIGGGIGIKPRFSGKILEVEQVWHLQ